MYFCRCFGLLTPWIRPLILSVDDDEVNQEVIRSALQNDYDIVSVPQHVRQIPGVACFCRADDQLPDVALHRSYAAFRIAYNAKQAQVDFNAAMTVTLGLRDRVSSSDDILMFFSAGIMDLVPSSLSCPRNPSKTHWQPYYADTQNHLAL